MLLKTKIAVTSVTNLHDARYCAGMGVNWVSFPITGDKAVSPEDFEEIIGWITGPELFAEVIGKEEADLGKYQFDGLLTDQEELFDKFASDVPCIFALSIDDEDTGILDEKLTRFGKIAKAVLLQSAYPLEEQNQEWLTTAGKQYPVILSMPFTPEEAQKALGLSPFGLGLKGSEELKVGLNDFDELADVLEALEVED